VEELKKILLNSLYIWTWVYNSFLIFMNLWISVFLLIINGGYLLYTSYVLGLYPSVFINDMNYL
jgi:hypothetical protein